MQNIMMSRMKRYANPSQQQEAEVAMSCKALELHVFNLDTLTTLLPISIHPHENMNCLLCLDVATYLSLQHPYEGNPQFSII